MGAGRGVRERGGGFGSIGERPSPPAPPVGSQRWAGPLHGHPGLCSDPGPPPAAAQPRGYTLPHAPPCLFLRRQRHPNQRERVELPAAPCGACGGQGALSTPLWVELCLSRKYVGSSPRTCASGLSCRQGPCRGVWVKTRSDHMEVAPTQWPVSSQEGHAPTRGGGSWPRDDGSGHRWGGGAGAGPGATSRREGPCPAASERMPATPGPDSGPPSCERINGLVLSTTSAARCYRGLGVNTPEGLALPHFLCPPGAVGGTAHPTCSSLETPSGDALRGCQGSSPAGPRPLPPGEPCR